MEKCGWCALVETTIGKASSVDRTGLAGLVTSAAWQIAVGGFWASFVSAGSAAHERHTKRMLQDWSDRINRIRLAFSIFLPVFAAASAAVFRCWAEITARFRFQPFF